jgi:death-on-curing protein
MKVVFDLPPAQAEKLEKEAARLGVPPQEQTGGAAGIRDLGLLDSALAQPKATLGGSDLHAIVSDKAPALCVSLVQNHPSVDGTKRIGHAAMETFLVLNGLEVHASVDEQDRMMLEIASGTRTPARRCGRLASRRYETDRY